jgi:hypothetical protein
MGLDACAGNDIWGTSSDDIYFVGVEGSIVHYDGTAFTRLESGTELTLRDIGGFEKSIFIVGYDDSGELSGQSIAMELRDGRGRTLFTSSSYLGDPAHGDYGRFQAVQVLGDTVYFTTGGAWLVKYNYLAGDTVVISKYRYFSDGYRLIDISGDTPNDLFMTSAWGDVFHYNGVSWFHDTGLYDQFGPANFFPRAGELRGDVATTVGYLSDGWRGIVARGYRMK